MYDRYKIFLISIIKIFEKSFAPVIYFSQNVDLKYATCLRNVLRINILFL